VTEYDLEAAAAAMVGAELAEEKLGELMARLAPCLTRREPWLQAARYVRARMSGLPRKNGWTIAAEAGNRTPDKTQRLLSHASWAPWRRCARSGAS
jgi:hypothetical protein